MSIYTFYRVCIWPPIAVPAAIILMANLSGLRLALGPVVGEVAYSLVYDGLPYAVLAAWATWRGQPETKIIAIPSRSSPSFASFVVNPLGRRGFETGSLVIISD